MVFLSNLIESKGVLDLLDALCILKEKGHTFLCDIIGSETIEINASRLYHEISQRELMNFVTYQGGMTGKEKTDMVKDSDIFVFPTYYPNECFPLVLLEAMQQGVPCISTSEGAICDIIDDGVTGLICEKNNPQDLAEKIETLILNPELRQRMGQAGREKYERELTIGRFERRMTDILKELAC